MSATAPGSTSVVGPGSAPPGSSGTTTSSSSSSTASFLAEVQMLKLGGVAAWHAALFLLAGSAWRATGPGGLGAAASLSSLAHLLLCYTSCLAPVLLAQRRLLTSQDVPPLYVERLGWGSRSWPCLLAARCLLRRRSLGSVGEAGLLYAAAGASGVLGMLLLQPLGSKGGRAPLLYAVTLAALYAVGYLIRAKNVLSFPVLQRHRYFRIKQRLPAMAKSTLWLASLGLLLSSLLGTLLLRGPEGASSGPGGWASLAAAAAAWRVGCLLVFGWASGGHVLEVVFTEGVAMADGADPTPTPPLLEALQSSDPIVQDWCLMDLAGVAEGAAGTGGRRAALFADETGAGGWTPLARYCLTELTDFVAVMAAALPALAGSAAGVGGGTGGAAAKAAGGGGGVRWNSLQLSASGGRVASRQQDLAAWHLQARAVRLVWCMRSLAGLCAAGLAADRYGLLQLGKPDLGDVLTALLGVVAVLRSYVKHTSAIHSRPAGKLAQLLSQLNPGSGGGFGGGGGGGSSSSSSGAGGGSQQHVDAAAFALLDVAQTATYRLTNTYGAVLAGVVAARPPLVGSAGDAAALLNSFLECQQ